MKKINKLEKSYVDFLKKEVREFNEEKRNGLEQINKMLKSREINGGSADLMWEEEYKRFENAVENLLCSAISRGCCYKSLYGIARVAFFDEYATDFLNDIIYRVKEAEAWAL